MNHVPPSVESPSKGELDARLKNLQIHMAAAGLDVYVCQSPDNIYYLTNFANFVHERPFILIIPQTGQPYFLVPELEEPHVACRSVLDLERVTYEEFPARQPKSWDCRLWDLVEQGARVGVEETSPAYLVRALGEQIQSTVVYLPLVDQLREIKSPYEISRIEYTSVLLSKGHQLLLEGARVGKSFIEANSEVSKWVMTQLLTDKPTTNMLASNVYGMVQPPSVSDDPHNFTNVFMTMEEGGPHVTVVSGKADGYGAEVERTFFLNQVPEAAQRPFEVMLNARALAFELLKPGECMGEVDRRVRQYVNSEGYGDTWLHRTGHSFGVTQHEGPFLADGDEREIKKDMVFSIEPGIYLSGLGGFRFSDTVLVTETGNRCLTFAPETLAELTIKRGSDRRPAD
ncbi:aminopeptidase P family protein [Pseudomaricurvus alkylphenolicus]|uniref:M24 family metallopeptidase n=1 Tax=Pseudomaricurvus alkylphenolicus TaxID=1306991 RepID=UPI00141F39B2|nr:Xaa-Pro peptidase family protein [Pseudomaricurvus alkylphenolicus]NIB42658.1 aminopeptidase P family protein [Pseudomaricurvus alkylphenolicus]